MAGANKHPYHLVDPSPWPAVGATAALLMLFGAVVAMHPDIFGESLKPTFTQIGWWIAVPGLLLVLFTMFVWWRDVTDEAEHQGHHTPVVQLGLRYGMALFIASEVMFFSAFFWAFFDNSLYAAGGPVLDIPYFDPAIWQQEARHLANGGVWPPKHIQVFDPWDLPFLNTMILLLSGCTVTWAHHALREGKRGEVVWGLGITVLLGLSFTALQAVEYLEAPFSFGFDVETSIVNGKVVAGGAYPSTFFMATGFHGFHVIVGTIFLAVCWVRAQAGHFKADHHFGFEAAAWYWHFVDVVWLFLFFCIYIWGSAGAPIAAH